MCSTVERFWFGSLELASQALVSPDGWSFWRSRSGWWSAEKKRISFDCCDCKENNRHFCNKCPKTQRWWLTSSTLGLLFTVGRMDFRFLNSRFRMAFLANFLDDFDFLANLSAVGFLMVVFAIGLAILTLVAFKNFRWLARKLDKYRNSTNSKKEWWSKRCELRFE